MRFVHPEFGDMTADVAAELAILRQQEEERAFREALARQQHIARATGQEARTLACGHVSAQIDAAVFAYWERREGRGFWHDKSNRRFMLKRHPELRVHSRSAKTTIQHPGLPGRAPAPAAGVILDAHGRAAA